MTASSFFMNVQSVFRVVTQFEGNNNIDNCTYRHSKIVEAKRQ
jgi:hypothetical protein